MSGWLLRPSIVHVQPGIDAAAHKRHSTAMLWPTQSIDLMHVPLPVSKCMTVMEVMRHNQHTGHSVAANISRCRFCTSSIVPTGYAPHHHIHKHDGHTPVTLCIVAQGCRRQQAHWDPARLLECPDRRVAPVSCWLGLASHMNLTP
jgi:hypothetical protein